MNISISTTGSTNKPTNIGSITFLEMDLPISTVFMYLIHGHSIQAPYGINNAYTLKGLKKSQLFTTIPYVAVDLDNIPYSWDELIEILRTNHMLPTMAYTTFSHNLPNKGNRYRLIYVFDNPLTEIQYRTVYPQIVNKMGLSVTDNCMGSPFQICHGTKTSANTFLDDTNVYNLAQFNLKPVERISQPQWTTIPPKGRKAVRSTLCSHTIKSNDEWCDIDINYVSELDKKIENSTVKNRKQIMQVLPKIELTLTQVNLFN